MTSHLLLTISTFATGWSLGAAWQWWFQRGQCRSCRIRYAVRRLLHPFAVRMAAKNISPEQRKQVQNVTAIAEVALAFAPMATMKFCWSMFVQWFKMKGQRVPHAR